MKCLFFIILIFLSSCNLADCKEDRGSSYREGNGYMIVYDWVYIQEHQYLLISWDGRIGCQQIIHAPECKKCKEVKK